MTDRHDGPGGQVPTVGPRKHLCSLLLRQILSGKSARFRESQAKLVKTQDSLRDELSQAVAAADLLRVDTARKIEVAEGLRRQAMSAYRIAAEAWRAVTAHSELRPVESPAR